MPRVIPADSLRVMKILVVEDFGPVRGAVVTALRDEGWAVEIAADGNTALEKITGGDFDLVVLDLMLPGLDGIQVLQRMRAEGNGAHVLVMTARDQISDRVAVLNGGADDYLTKPFAIEELIARAHALLRRKYERKSPVIRVGPLEVRATEHRVLMGGEEVDLTAREYALLEALAFRSGELVTRDQLHSSLYGDQESASSNVVDVYVGYLRKKLEVGGAARLLHTRRGQGFILEERPGAVQSTDDLGLGEED